MGDDLQYKEYMLTAMINNSNKIKTFPTAGHQQPDVHKPMTIRILIADDHALVRQTLCMLLERAEGLEVVAEAENGQRALELARELRPDVALIDISMPRMTGLEATAHISQLPQNTRVIVLSVHNNLLQTALDNGASGYVLKQDSTSDLVEAIEQVYQGERFVSPRLVRSTV